MGMSLLGSLSDFTTEDGFISYDSLFVVIGLLPLFLIKFSMLTVPVEL